MKQSCTNVQPGSGQTKRALVVDKDEARCWPRALPVVEKRKTRCWPRAIPNAQLCCSTELGARGKPKIRCGSAQETCQGVASRRVGGIAETMRWGARRRRRHPRPNQNYKRGGGGIMVQRCGRRALRRQLPCKTSRSDLTLATRGHPCHSCKRRRQQRRPWPRR